MDPDETARMHGGQRLVFAQLGFLYFYFFKFIFQLPVRWGHWVAIIWNIVWFTYFTVLLFVDVFCYTVDRNIWIIFLSNWTFLLAICTTLVEIVTRMYLVKCLGALDKEDSSTPGMIWLQKIQWTLYNTNNVVSVSMTIVFFCLFDIDISLSSASKHVLTTLYVILNTSTVSTIPVKILHFYQPAVFFILYAIVISIYQNVASHEGIFLALDWDKPRNTAILLSCLVSVGPLFLHFLFYCVFRVRKHLFKKCSNSDSSIPLTSTMQRDITATDVILEESGNSEFIDIKPDVKDDIAVKSASSANGDAFKHYNGRLYRSETDLRDYRLKNGLFCEFAKSSLILHSSIKTTNDIFGDDTDIESQGTKTPERKGSQIIVVKKCKTCANDVEDEDSANDVEDEDNGSNCDSSASSDYLSKYISEDLLAYL